MSTIGLILSLCVVLSRATKHEVDKTKRILLNDPDVAYKIASMETTIQKLSESVTLLQQASTIKDQTIHKLFESVTILQQAFASKDQTIQKLSESVSKLETENLRTKTTLLEHASKSQGSSYIRWGRKQCSAPDTQTLYSGFTSGQEYTHGSYYGGPGNILCLPDNPDPSNRTGFSNSLLYGTEFEDGSFFGPHAQDEDVPCAVCISTNTSVSLMIPGKSTCYSGWKLEYNGYLGSGGYGSKASSYICVDSNPEYLQGGGRSDDQNLLFATTLKCGSMPCPPYTNNQAVNCVVCSK